MMEKSNYKRRIPATETRKRTSATTRGSSLKTKADFKEVILMQSIVSSIILASVMFICVVKTDFTVNLRQNLKKALSTSTTVDEMEQTKNSVSSKYSSLENTVKTIFGNTTDKTDTIDKTNTTDKISTTQKVINQATNTETDITNKPVGQTTINEATETEQTDRIDEDILKALNGDESIEEKK